MEDIEISTSLPVSIVNGSDVADMQGLAQSREARGRPLNCITARA